MCTKKNETSVNTLCCFLSLRLCGERSKGKGKTDYISIEAEYC